MGFSLVSVGRLNRFSDGMVFVLCFRQALRALAKPVGTVRPQAVTVRM
ncbi:hypothetical protein [Uruburuella suis]|nr:hypothetical protein [Uruburuella suis]